MRDITRNRFSLKGVRLSLFAGLFQLPIFRSFCILLLSAGMILALAITAFAGPPFLTDDPEPVDFKHWEVYLFGTVDSTVKNGISGTGPALEVNVGALPNLQLHMVLPLAFSIPQSGRSIYGLGDLELGFKYRFIKEKEAGFRPMVAIFPMLEIPTSVDFHTGSATKGFGNGQVWYKLPIWLQKSFGHWTTYGGFGYGFNPAPGQRNFPYGGWLLQRELGKRLILGGEIFAQGQSSNDTRSFAVFNLGGFFKITENFQLLFSGGHTLAGANHTIGYLGLYWTGKFGKKEEPEEKEKEKESFGGPAWFKLAHGTGPLGYSLR